jgi:hypothetical protein
MEQPMEKGQKRRTAEGAQTVKGGNFLLHGFISFFESDFFSK